MRADVNEPMICTSDGCDREASAVLLRLRDHQPRAKCWTCARELVALWPLDWALANSTPVGTAPEPGAAH